MNPGDEHNLHSSRHAPVLVMCRRAGRPGHAPESEPVLVCRDGNALLLVLDDGERLEFDFAELLSAATGYDVRLTTRRAA